MNLVLLMKRLRVPGRGSAELVLAPGPVFTVEGRVSDHTHNNHSHFGIPNTSDLIGIREGVAGF